MANKPFFTGDFLETGREFAVGGDDVYVFPYELIVPVAITPITDADDPGELDLFPAKIDPGFSGNFHIAQRHLEHPSWANASLDQFKANGETTTYVYANCVPENLHSTTRICGSPVRLASFPSTYASIEVFPSAARR
jgi:hypothetical protein